MRPFASGFGVLRDRRYRRFLAAAVSYSIGLWSFQTVIVWTILEQTNSAEAVSLLTISVALPTLLFSLPAGLLADRLDPRRVMFIGQVGGTIAIAAVVLATATGFLSLPLGALAIFVVGTFDAMTNVPSMVYVGRLVEPRLMASAIGLTGLQYGAGRIGGGIVAGLAFQLGGPIAGLVICAAALATSAAIVSTLPRLPRAESGGLAGAGLGDLRAAVTWVRRSPPAVAIIALGLAAATFVYSYFTLLPVFARDALGGSAVSLGLLTSSGGVGVVLGAICVDAVGRRIGRGRAIVAALVVASFAFAALGQSRILPLSMALTALMTAGLGVYRVTCQLVLQTLAPARIRGRVLATFELTFWGIFSVGTLAAGVLADRAGPSFVAATFGGATLAGVAVLLIAYRPFLRLDVDSQGRGVLGRKVLSTPARGAEAPIELPLGATAPLEAGAELAAIERSGEGALLHAETNAPGWLEVTRTLWLPFVSIVKMSWQQLSLYLRSAFRTNFVPSGEYRAKPPWWCCPSWKWVIFLAWLPSGFMTQTLLPKTQQSSVKTMWLPSGDQSG